MLTGPESRMDEGGHALHLTTIMTTASTPATPGPSTPTAVRTLPLDQLKVNDSDEDIVPPIRPQSTPFPEQEMVEGDIKCPRRLSDLDQYSRFASTVDLSKQPASNSLLYGMPVEIQEGILDCLFGVRSSATSRPGTAGMSKVLRGWGTALRHSRRREVSELALVSKKWRELIQDRLYRHLKIKGTRESVDVATMWFHDHPHLCPYVKHIEIWFPVFQQKNPAFDRTLRIPSTTPDRSTVLRSTAQLAETGNIVTYLSPSNNCTVEEAFRFIAMTFGEACILTLEGGDRKKPPMVRHFLTSEKLPVIESIRTLVCKGQWNLIRSNEDFQNIAAALPNLTEWHGSYAKPKSKSYLSMATILPSLPQHLTHLNVCIEADYRREGISPRFSKKVADKTHFCIEMAKAIPTLEHLVYTGRICQEFFNHAAKLSRARDSRLRSVDLIVKNSCRDPTVWNDGSGILEYSFALAFEALVISGIKALNKFTKLDLLRIRFIDLGKCCSCLTLEKLLMNIDSQVPALNHYFQLSRNQCTGLFSDEILQNLAKIRPAASFLAEPEQIPLDIGFKDGVFYVPPSFSSKTPPLAIALSSYFQLSNAITIT